MRNQDYGQNVENQQNKCNAVLHRSLTFLHKLDFGMFMFITYIFKVTFVGLAPKLNFLELLLDRERATQSDRERQTDREKRKEKGKKEDEDSQRG